ncbi:MAG TPA: hypothetical protein PK971_14895 [Saprospiraceae bacterium]|nr:hypothetical protein [Saprospiraceae bacterium]HND89618.1 hypothetical protein [Saprospiraceae bacterium]
MRTLIFTVLLLAAYSPASACDACGCSIGGNYFGILPQFHRHFVGIRWAEQSFQSAHSVGAAEAGRYATQERFRTVDLLARFYPSRRVQVLAVLPFHHFQRQEGSTLTHARGLGDAVLLGNYIVLNTGDSLGRHWQHSLTLGGGLKLPTGPHQLRDGQGTALLANMQPGSGSTDVLLSAAYTLRRGAWGFNADALGRLNTANAQGYRFGHRLSASAKFFYWTRWGKRLTLLPNAGVFADAAQRNRSGGEQVEATGGYLVLGTGGLDVYAGRFSVGFTYQQPLHQQLGQGQIRASQRWMTTLNYLFGG